MLRFLFNVDGGPAKAIEAPTLAQAKCDAVRFAGQLICDSAEKFWDTAGFELEVTDEDGLLLFTLQMIGTEAPVIRNSNR